MADKRVLGLNEYDDPITGEPICRLPDVPPDAVEVLRKAAEEYPEQLLHDFCTGLASHIAAIDSSSEAVRQYLERELRGVVSVRKLKERSDARR